MSNGRGHCRGPTMLPCHVTFSGSFQSHVVDAEGARRSIEHICIVRFALHKGLLGIFTGSYIWLDITGQDVYEV